jgi:4-phytase/acid phosphatase
VKNNVLLLIAVAILVSARGLAGDLQLKYVVIVSRHGVRAPTWEASRLNEYSAEPWPDWGVPPGNLTPHGRRAIELMGDYYRRWLTAEHLIDPKSCRDASHMTVYADKDQRTIETGRALAETLQPGCALQTASQQGVRTDTLFSGTFSPDPALAAKAVSERLDPQLLQHHLAAFETLQYTLGPGRSKVLDPTADLIKGSFATGSTLTENLLLEYTNGMPKPGWGRLTRENLQQVLAIHAAYADLMRRTPYLARRGSNLLAAILHSIEQSAWGHSVDGAIGKTGDSILILSGHDTNLSNLSGLLQLSWKLAGYQTDDTPPGSALIFSLWQSQSGPLFVRLRFVAQTPDQMRNLDPGPPASEELRLRGCDPCTFAQFMALCASIP